MKDINIIKSIEVLCHSCVKFNFEKIIYFDPFKVSQNYNDADLIFITHSHYDHFSEEDILKVKRKDSKIILTTDLEQKAKKLGFEKEKIIVVKPNESIEIDGIKINTISAYNVNKQFHPKENNWLGYIIKIDDCSFYIAGDTDVTEENMNVKCDVAFVPVGGTFTMTADEAAKLVNHIKPKFAVPTHYGSIVGDKEDGSKFIKLLDPDIIGKNLLDNKTRIFN